MWRKFHHPDISLPVIRRQLSDQLLDLLAEVPGFAVAPVHALMSPGSFSSKTAYYNAVSRLRKQGLVAYRRTRRRAPVLMLTPPPGVGRRLRPQPEKHWKRKWNGIWYVLVYDIPEKEKSYRETLRGFLRRLRMGCLQKSVWVAAHDIRPEYSDLVKAAAADDCSFLFESKTVLGQSATEVVCAAWNWMRVAQVQNCFCEVYGQNLQRLCQGAASSEMLAVLGREACAAYQAAWVEDPLLPKELWPPAYRGPEVAQLYGELMQEIRTQLANA